jgi:Spy/CpxP family protein refolding chaperone
MNPRLRNILIVGAIFVAGVVTGSVNSIGVGRRLAEHRLRVDNLRSTLMDILKSELELTPEQVVRIEPLVNQACEEYRTLTLETVQRVTQLVQAANGRIARELTPEQAARLKRLEEERQARVRKKLEQDYLKKDFLAE